MKTRWVRMVAVLLLIGMGLSVGVLAATKIEGKVADVKMTVCSAVSGKPGMCEGTLRIGKTEIAVTREVKLMVDGKQVLLPALQGTMAKVAYRSKNGKKIATAVEATSVKKP